MIRYAFRRFGTALIVVVAVSIITFLVTHVVLTDPVDAVLGGQASTATPQQIATLRHQLLLDQPVPVQYWDWIRQVLEGNLGRSFLRPQSVASMISSALPVTVELTLLSMVIAVVFGVALGVTAAVRQRTAVDAVSSGASVLLMSVPNFFLGIVLVYLLSITVPVFPVGGYVSLTSNPVQNLDYMVLPSLTLATGYIGIFARYTRSLMVRILSEEYITHATAGGLSRKRVVLGHALRTASAPLLTAVGLNVSGLVGGAVVVESIYSLPGMGTLLTNSILGSDLPVISALVLFITVGVTVITWAVDVLNGILDPRAREASA